MPSDPNSPPSLDERLRTLTRPDPDPKCLYYAITLTADDDLKVIFGLQTSWVGWTDDTMRHELRKGRLVYARFKEIWEKIGQPYAFVLTLDDLILFLLGGGNALVKKELAETIFAAQLAAEPVANVGPIGFQSLDDFDRAALARAPTPRLRMDIFKRDGRKCRVCGRRPDDYTDLELHIHHIRPWARGGLTDPSNLITLCHTCHKGLVPHEDHSLYGYLAADEDNPVTATLLRFTKEVSNYRKVGFFGNLDLALRDAPKKKKSRRRYSKRAT